MLRLFLKKKLKNGKESTAKRSISRPSFRRNQRLVERYNVNQDTLRVLNEQDILTIRDISQKGFSSDVSDRAYLRFILGDVYEARLKYLKELHDFKIKLSWKRNRALGFEIVSTSKSAKAFLERLIKPIEIANSLKEVKADFLPEQVEGKKVWFHTDRFNSDLSIWFKDNSKLEAWLFSSGSHFVEWQETKGIRTGTYETPKGLVVSDTLAKVEPSLVQDTQLSQTKLLFAFDVIMALNSAYKHPILETIEE